MILPKKTLVAVSLGFASFLGIIFIASSTVLLLSLKRAEEQQTRQAVAGVLNVFTQIQADNVSLLADWSYWDDTYAFVKDGNQDYIDSNLNPESLAVLKINLALFVRPSGQVTYGTGFDLTHQKKTPVSEAIRAHLSPQDRLLQHPNLESSLAGILLLPEGPMLVSSRPIATSERKGPIHGTLIFGRSLDQNEVARLSKISRFSLNIQALNQTQLPSDFQAARDSLSVSNPVAIRPLSEQLIAGYTLLRDIYGQPALILRVDVPREIYQQGQSSLRYLIASLLIVGLAFGGVTLILLQRLLQSQYQRQQSEARYRSLVSQTSEAIFLVNPDTKQILETNAAFKALLGYATEAVCKLTLYDVAVEAWASVDQDLFILQEKHSFIGERQYRCQDGRILDVEINANLITHDGRIVLCILAHDITERKQAEADIRHTLEKEKELGELKSRFVSMTSHEFRTPLATILSSSELLEHYGHKWSEEKKLVHLQRIQVAVKHMTGLLNDVLLIGKAEAGRLEFEPTPLDLVQFCRDLVEEIQLGANHLKNGCPSLLAFSTQGLCPACMDEKLLRHILSNLLSNAIKYSPQGGTVYLDLVYNQTEAVFHVQDEGIGIPPADQAQLFNSFHRASNVGTISGTGLGLAIVKKSVELHGGQITVRSEVGVGTTFTVTLPRNK